MINEIGLDHLLPTTSTEPRIQRQGKKREINYLREHDLSERFNASLVTTLNIPLEDYYGRLSFDDLLCLKEGLARVHEIITLKLTFAMVDWIARQFSMSDEDHDELKKKVNHIHPNASGFDIDLNEPNIIAEIKGTIPVNKSHTFGSAQLKGLTADVFQMLGQPAPNRREGEIPSKNKIKRAERESAIKFLCMYDSPKVRSAAKKWSTNLMRHPDWKPIQSCKILNMSEGSDLSPDVIYMVFVNPEASMSATPK
jgi:hypothetical protein